ncbi:adhesin [Phyllobacterium sp. 628]|uniref:YadA family autotransporter adhesin n=1 Tax=Phyllobacterium sp. 628 TaxID=2718938 RepID=UPI0016627B26|nr:YadA-like family protein [Phyllobacterium sp. 628]QND51443.1 adhesin [Phyllobacterium sp. 628]
MTYAAGPYANAVGSHATAMGPQASASGNAAMASGANSVARGTNATAIGANARATAANSVALGANSVATEPDTVSFGSPGNERRLSNIAPGVLPNDAVNMRQFEQGVWEAKREAHRGTATAVAMLNANPVLEHGKKFALSLGFGSYGSQQALAGGAAIRFTDNFTGSLNFGTSLSGGSTAIGTGISYQW